MKQFYIIVVFITTVVQSNGQTFSEWFRQNKTQKKYLLEQIAALQVYTDYLEKGYFIVHARLSHIKNSKQGDVRLHADYFNSLLSIKPTIRNYRRVNDIIGLKLEIESISRRILKQVKAVKVLKQAQRDYIGFVLNQLIEGCAGDVELLLQLLTPNLLQLKDNERLDKIEGLYEDMQERYLFARSFENKIHQLQLNQASETKDIEAMQKAFDIKK